MKKSADIEIAVQVRTVTEKAMLVSGDGETYVWVPKSQIADWSGSEELGAKVETIFLPEWLATEKGLV